MPRHQGKILVVDDEDSRKADFADTSTLLGFLSVIAVELLQLTYLHRTQPTADAIVILNPLQLRILKAKSPKPPKILTVSWAVEAIARLGGYLDKFNYKNLFAYFLREQVVLDFTSHFP